MMDVSARWVTHSGRLLVMSFLVLVTAGCVSRAAIQRMGDQLDYLEASQKRMERDLVRMDSLVTKSATASNKTRADVGASLDEFRGETFAIREAVDELRRQIEKRPPQVIYQPAPVTSNAGEGSSEAATGGSSAQAQPDIDPSQLYENAFLDVRNGNYELAIEQFRDVLTFFGETDYAPNARYWIGECLYSLEKYDEAIVEFDILLSKFPQSDRIPTALYKMGRCYEELGRPRRAKGYYERVVNDYPNSLEAKPSQSRLAQMD